ncbi:hypothetical protein GDO81_014847 [Engystomops pustulosus]|uniref:Uncharacterized protein n=1 Tax=Engystomops pustulosus TaxID=76066 RepID=A0AAV7AL83_ENGPU|nr:hypothetical protein GDO81_014847 [Engystomops pustulosus]
MTTKIEVTEINLLPTNAIPNAPSVVTLWLHILPSYAKPQILSNFLPCYLLILKTMDARVCPVGFGALKCHLNTERTKIYRFT